MGKGIEAMHRAPRCKKCTRNALKGTELCKWHTPGMRPNLRRLDLAESLLDVKHFISRMIQDCRKGLIEPRVMTAIISGCNSLIKVHEIEEVQEVLVKMQKDVLRQRLSEVDLPEGAEVVFDDANMNPVKYTVDLEAADGEVREGVTSN